MNYTSTYETDVLEWSTHQAHLLRRLAAGEVGSEAPDWANVIGEIEDVGNSAVPIASGTAARPKMRGVAAGVLCVALACRGTGLPH